MGRQSRIIKWEDLESVFVNNLPEVTFAEQLRIAFSSVGRVFDAFIPASGRRGRGFCFDFVCFADMGTALRAVKMLDGASFAGRVLEVNVAKFGWSQRQRERDVGEDKKRVAELSPIDKMDLLPTREWLPVKSSSIAVSKRRQGVSFLDAVKGNHYMEENPLCVSKEIITNNSRWLSNSLVGTVRSEEVIPSITSIYELGGIRGVKVSTLGSKKVLISFPNLEEVSSQVEVLNFDHNQVFVYIERWVTKPIILSRIVWLHCFGVPLHGWSVEVFLAIGRKFGAVGEIAKETIDKSQLKFERVCVQT